MPAAKKKTGPALTITTGDGETTIPLTEDLQHEVEELVRIWVEQGRVADSA